MNSDSRQKYAVFFLSTGRCATQWFADSLARHYQDLAVVRHEPFQKRYEPRRYFRAYHNGERPPLTRDIQQHLDSICTTLESSHYIEVGWPCYGVLPFFLSRLHGRVKLIHLYRHPVRVAASLATHRVYSRGQWSDTVAIAPSDRGVSQSELDGRRWSSMSEFEKCLFWWTEINHFALRLKSDYSSVPWLSLQYEQVFGEHGTDTLSELLRFLSFPHRDAFLQATGTSKDLFVSKTHAALDLRAIEKYPHTLSVMSSLGYQGHEPSVAEIKRRYQKSLLQRGVWQLENSVRVLAARVNRLTRPWR
jgi:hypothetical protein